MNERASKLADEWQRWTGTSAHRCERGTAECLHCRARETVNALRDASVEIERLIACLKIANANHERFEREWYLRGDEIERLIRERDEWRKLAHAARHFMVSAETKGDALQDLAYRDGAQQALAIAHQDLKAADKWLADLWERSREARAALKTSAWPDCERCSCGGCLPAPGYPCGACGKINAEKTAEKAMYGAGSCGVAGCSATEWHDHFADER